MNPVRVSIALELPFMVPLLRPRVRQVVGILDVSAGAFGEPI